MSLYSMYLRDAASFFKEQISESLDESVFVDFMPAASSASNELQYWNTIEFFRQENYQV